MGNKRVGEMPWHATEEEEKEKLSRSFSNVKYGEIGLYVQSI